MHVAPAAPAPATTSGQPIMVRNPDGTTGLFIHAPVALPGFSGPLLGFARLSFTVNFGLQRQVAITAGGGERFDGSAGQAMDAARALAVRAGQAVGLSDAGDGTWLLRTLMATGIDSALDELSPAELELVPLRARDLGEPGAPRWARTVIGVSPGAGEGVATLQAVFGEDGRAVHLDARTGADGIPPVPPLAE